MPNQRYTQAARRRDERAYELLMSGYTIDQVAERVGLSVGEVTAGQDRLEDEWNRLGPEEGARQRLLLTYKVITSESMRAWQRSLIPPPPAVDDETGEPDARPAPPPAGDSRHLNRALRAAFAERKLRCLTAPPLDLPPAEDEETPAAQPKREPPAANDDLSFPAEFLPRPLAHVAPANPGQTIADVCARSIANGRLVAKAK